MRWQYGILFSGDFPMPGRLLVDDANTYLTTAKRVAAFVSDRTASSWAVTIEMDTAGRKFPWQSQYHPHEHVLEMTKQSLLALAAAFSSFNGFNSKKGTFILMDPVHILITLAVLTGLVLIALVLMRVRYTASQRA